MAGSGLAYGLNGFVQGMQQGAQIMDMVDKAKERKALRNMAAEGLDAAKAERQQQIDGAITERKEMVGTQPGTGVLANPAQAGLDALAKKSQTTPADTPIITGGAPAGPLDGLTSTPKELQGITDLPASNKPEVKTSYKVKGSDKTFDSRESAATLAERQADSMTDLFYKNMGPKVQEFYLGRGDVEKAKAWGDYMDDQATKTGMKHWARGMALINMGDTRAGMDALMKAQHTAGYGSDLKITSYDAIKDKDGKETGGVRVKYVNGDGVDGYQDFDSLEDAAATAVNLLNPKDQFAWYEKRRAEGAASKAKALERRTKLNDELYALDYKDRLGRNAKADELNLRAKLGLGTTGKGASSRDPSRQYMHPRDVRMKLYELAMKNDYKFRNMDDTAQAAYLENKMRTMGLDDTDIKASTQAAPGAAPAEDDDYPEGRTDVPVL